MGFEGVVFVICIVGLAFLGGGWVWLSRDVDKLRAEEAEAKKYIEFTSEDVLLLKERNPILEKAIKILDSTDVHYARKPDELVYTGATVGGIHTGGYHVKEGYTYISGSTRNGKAVLKFGVTTIRYIQLTNELYKQAKTSAIKQYLNRDKQIVVMDRVTPSLSELSALSSTHVGTVEGASALHDVVKRGYPTREKCEEIKKWVCGLE